MPYLSAADVPLNGDQVAMAITYGTFGSHLGVALRDENGAAKLLHLAWHRMLSRDEYPQDNWAAQVANLPASAMSLVAPVIRGMLCQYEDIKGEPRYGVNLYAGRGAVRANGDYLTGPGSDGHTCSSFVADIFNGAGVPLVDLDSWLPTDQNKAWGEAVACCLERWGQVHQIAEMPVHVAAVRANNQGLRVLPEEIAAAAVLPDAGRNPAKQDDVRAAATEVLQQMQRVCERGGAYPPFQPCVDAYEAALATIAAKQTAGEPQPAVDVPPGEPAA